MSDAWPLSLFEGYGIELEYMIVDRDTLRVRPLCDEVLRAVSPPGMVEMEVERGDVAWSNELALHVIEMKTNGPMADIAPFAHTFQRHVRDINALLREHNAMLLPSGMHPTMDSLTELTLWPHENDVIYNTLHRIFDCRGHGWANLQSMHINLPFSDDEQFGRLHAAIRVVLPLLPALSASTPFADGKAQGATDFRLVTYRDNAAKIPSVTGQVVPEPVFTPAEYERDILQHIYADMRDVDPEGVCRHEWINARGAIARFDRGAIEIRVIDVQEHPGADLAVAELTIALVRALCEERLSKSTAQRALSTDSLAALFNRVIVDGERAMVSDPALLTVLGLPPHPTSAGAVWTELLDLLPVRDAARAHIEVILDEGTLATRLLRAAGPQPTPARLTAVYRTLAGCLAEGRAFHAGAELSDAA